ncbi:PE family protein [Amycolatopsis arida]|uniref:PE family protein n=1 Tax=Amycolatopsis arida TaxID=587909 RepID=A0A1I5T2S3_9PSEU|nr:PE domain-containing protein [Amycolatopsis arida]TDX96251.1 PE family protein [Amycolatopsis arida]SFP77329.1 PE family protein [Amycolatopsis arida]
MSQNAESQAEHGGSSAPVPFPLGGAVPEAPAVRDIQVDPGRVLDVAKVIEEQANALQDRLRAQLGALRVEPPSEDIVSVHAVQAWNAITVDGEQSYESRVRAYLEGLRELVAQLRAASEQYTASEREKAESFGDRQLPSR